MYIFFQDRKKKIIKLKKEFKQFENNFFFCSGDIGKKKDVEKFIKLAKNQFKVIHGIIFSSGGPEIGNFESINDKIWIKNFNIHCLGFLNIIKKIVPIFKKNRFGRIVVISSMSAKQPIPGRYIKFFKTRSCRNMQSIPMQLIKFNITINTISPGSVLTDRSKKIIQSRANRNKITFSKSYNESLKKIPIGRFANPDEIAELAKFLCSEKSSYLTGGIYMVDGGKYLSI